MDITKGAVISLKQLVSKKLRKAVRKLFQKHRQEPPTSEHWGHYLSFNSGHHLDKFNLSLTLYAETQAHPKASKYSKTEKIFTATGVTSGATIWQKIPLHFSPSVTTVSDC